MARYAAVDIGSNSLRMQVAEVVNGQSMTILASDREVTRLGESVFRSGFISPQALDSACQVLSRMALAYHRLDVMGVRAVATSAVRDARNQAEFLDRASACLGTPVEIISGQEEARLIHLGIQARWPHPNQRILIVDVGGGSAEIILGENGRMAAAFSKQLGAVRLKEVFLKNDPPTPLELHRLNEFIDEKIAPAVRRIGGIHIDRAIGTSATAAALASAVNRVPRDRRDGADRQRAATVQVRKLYEKLCERDLAGRRKVTGIGPRRAEVIVPGVALLLRVLQVFQLPALYYSVAGVRDGIIADLAARGVGRELTQLNRDQRRVVEEMAQRYDVPLKHARKVASLAQVLFASLQPIHQLPPNVGRILEAASYLHDIGHFVSETRHHKHSHYLVANSDMPGFTVREREMIANLSRYHRKSMPGPLHSGFEALTQEEQRAVVWLIPLLRLADGFDRSQEQRVESLECQISASQVLLQLRSSGDIDLEQWAGEAVSEVFRTVYGRTLVISKLQV